MSNNIQIIPLSRISLAELLGVYDDDYGSTAEDDTMEFSSTVGGPLSHHGDDSFSHGGNSSTGGGASAAKIIGLNTLQRSNSSKAPQQPQQPQSTNNNQAGELKRQNSNLGTATTTTFTSPRHHHQPKLAVNTTTSSEKSSQRKNGQSSKKKLLTPKKTKHHKHQKPYYQQQIQMKQDNSIWRSCLCNIRSKTLYVLVFSMIFLTLLFAAILLIVYSSVFNELGGKVANDAVLRIMANIYNDFDRTLMKQQSYANWDLVYALFSPGGYSDSAMTDFIDSYYFPEYVQLSHKVNFVGFYWLNGTLAKSIAYDLNTLDAIPYPSQFHELPPGHALNREMENIETRRGGFIRLKRSQSDAPDALDDQVALVSTVPIHFYGIASGILLYGRLLENSKILEYARGAQSCLTLMTQHQYDTSSKLRSLVQKSVKKHDFSAIVLKANDSSCHHCAPFHRSTWNQDLDRFMVQNRQCWDGDSGKASRTASFFLNEDIFGNENIVFRFDEELTLPQLAVQAFFFCYGILIFIVAIISIIVFLLFELTVVRPVSVLGKQLSQIVTQNNISKKIKIVDFGQIGQMTQYLNGLLQSLNNSVRMATEENESLYNVTTNFEFTEKQGNTVMNQLSHIVLVVDVNSGAVIRANQSFYQRLGYAPSSTQNNSLMLESVLDHSDVMQELSKNVDLAKSNGDESAPYTLQTTIKHAMGDLGGHAVDVSVRKVKMMNARNVSGWVYLLVAVDTKPNLDQQQTLDRLRQTLQSMKQPKV